MITSATGRTVKAQIKLKVHIIPQIYNETQVIAVLYSGKSYNPFLKGTLAKIQCDTAFQNKDIIILAAKSVGAVQQEIRHNTIAIAPQCYGQTHLDFAVEQCSKTNQEVYH